MLVSLFSMSGSVLAVTGSSGAARFQSTFAFDALGK